MAYLSEAEHVRVSAAVAAAEAATDGEIVTIVAGWSDEYRDVALHWAVLKLLSWLALLALWPGLAERIHAAFAGPWAPLATPAALFTIALILATLAFLAAQAFFAWRRMRIAFTPPATKARRVRRRAVALFRTAAEARTKAKTGVLLYLSLAEHRAEIVADAAIHSKVAPEVWGDAMAALISAVREGRTGDGIAEAVTQIGAVLAEHFPRSEGDTNELPDRLIEL
ncbi:MAG: hypothetical protein V4659_05465 [Pseudomonadota bacterium]